MPSTCSECGAALLNNSSRKDYFHALLLLEGEVALTLPAREVERGKVLHFYAVSAYIVQHPESMAFRLRQWMPPMRTWRITLQDECD